MQENAEPIADDTTPPAREYPTTFFDTEGREWSVVIRPSDVRRLEKAHQIDIWKADDLQRGPLVALTSEPVLLSALWMLCEEQAKARRIDEDSFCDAFNGKAFDAAFEAIQGAILVFFSGARASRLRKILAQLEGLRAAQLEKLDAFIEIQKEEAAKLRPIEEAKYRKAIQTEGPKLVDRELNRAICSEPTAKPPAPLA